MKNIKNNWSEYQYITECAYEDIDYYGLLEAEFENCTFKKVMFYWVHFNGIGFKNCVFENCTFAGVTFDEANFIECHLQGCSFTKSNMGSHCTAEDSYAVDCYMDVQSSKNNPLLISKNKSLLTVKMKEKLYAAFKTSRPTLAVDEPKHCLSCDETQSRHENIPDLKELTVDDFNICDMSVETFSTEAYLYYMPKLLELAYIGKDNEWDSFMSGFLGQLIPNKFGNRFENYNKLQIKLMIETLELIYQKYNRTEEAWDYHLEMMVDNSAYEDIIKYCKVALEFWKEKL